MQHIANAPDAGPEDKREVLAELFAEATIEGLTHVRRGRQPRLQLQAAITFREQITPRLLQEISLAPVEVEARHEAESDDTAYYLHTLAFHLLGLFREPRAFALMLDYFASDCDLAEELSGDAIGGYLPALLVRCYDGGDLRQLRLMIETEDYEPIFRHECFQAYHGLALTGQIDRAEVVAFAERLLDAVPEQATYNAWYVWLALAAAELQEPTLRPKIDALFDRGLTDDGKGRLFVVADKASIAKIYARSREEVADDILQPEFFDNFVESICDWHWFQKPRDWRPRDAAELAYEAYCLDLPHVRTAPKVGRNEPCPCGSGQKHKKCCLN